MIFYTGKAFPGWRGSLFIGSLIQHYLARLVLDGAHVIHEERLIGDRTWKFRAVQQAPDGSLYIGVDGGFVGRISPLP
jgi:glucose/arabinose dehydrogenase